MQACILITIGFVSAINVIANHPHTELGSLSLLGVETKGTVQAFNYSVNKNNADMKEHQVTRNRAKKVVIKSKNGKVGKNKGKKVWKARNDKSSHKSGIKRRKQKTPEQLHSAKLRAISRCKRYAQKIRARRLRAQIKRIRLMRRSQKATTEQRKLDKQQKMIQIQLKATNMAIAKQQRLLRIMNKHLEMLTADTAEKHGNNEKQKIVVKTPKIKLGNTKVNKKPFMPSLKQMRRIKKIAYHQAEMKFSKKASARRRNRRSVKVSQSINHSIPASFGGDEI